MKKKLPIINLTRMKSCRKAFGKENPTLQQQHHHKQQKTP